MTMNARGVAAPEVADPRRVLVVAGSDSSGCSGLQADLRILSAMGIHPLSAVTAVTAQSSTQLSHIEAIDSFVVEQQVAVALEDFGADCIKVGMLAQRATIELLARLFEQKARGIPIVLDPVLRSSSGHDLLPPAALDCLVQRLLPQCALLTPNLQEAEVLTGLGVTNEADMHAAADRLLLMGQNAVLIKGGHLGGDQVVDLLRTADGLERRFEGPRVAKNVRGTGCTLASAIAAGIADGLMLETAVERARSFVQSGIESAVRLPSGAHCFRPGSFMPQGLH